MMKNIPLAPFKGGIDSGSSCFDSDIPESMKLFK
jgi:hypothetical protein